MGKVFDELTRDVNQGFWMMERSFSIHLRYRGCSPALGYEA